MASGALRVEVGLSGLGVANRAWSVGAGVGDQQVETVEAFPEALNRIEVAEPVFVTVDAGLGVVGAPGSFTEAAQRAEREGTFVAEPAELTVTP